jgi:riboflavin kinase/FMN adenylyltransferase
MPQRVSSSLIRMLVAAGDVESAAACLGRPFALYGKVIRGEGRGRLLDFPTANLATTDQVLPADGVYAGRAAVAGAAFRAAISVGTRPTVGGVGRSVEAFLLDAEGHFYDKDMALSFVHRLRGIERFAGLEALREQIAKDVQRVRELIAH